MSNLQARARIILPPHIDNAPTPERAAKGDYEDCLNLNGKPSRRQAYPLDSLFKRGAIQGEHVAYAHRWHRDWQMSREGNMESPDAHHQDYERGDIHTWMTSRARSGDRIARIREIMGSDAHQRLEMVLSLRLSFSEMGRRLFPDLPVVRSGERVAEQCVMALTILPNTYQFARKAQEEEFTKKRDALTMHLRRTGEYAT